MSTPAPKSNSNPRNVILVLSAIAFGGIVFGWAAMKKSQPGDAAGIIAGPLPAPPTAEAPHLLPKGQKVMSCVGKENDWGYLCTMRPWRNGDVAEAYTIVNRSAHGTDVYHVAEVAP